MFTFSAGFNQGSGAPMESHGLHSIGRTFRRMWLDPRRAICVVNFSCYVFNVLFLSVPVSTDTVIAFCPHFSLYLDNFSATFTHVFRSEGISISISVHVFFCLS